MSHPLIERKLDRPAFWVRKLRQGRVDGTPTRIHGRRDVRVRENGEVVDRADRVVFRPPGTLAQTIQGPVPGDREEPGCEASAPGVVSDLPLPEPPEDVLHQRFGLLPIPEDSRRDPQGVAGVPVVEVFECSGLPSPQAPEQLSIGG